MAQNTALGVLSNIFTAPSAAFPLIKERPKAWLPLLLIILGNCIVSFAYLGVVDLPWMLDQQLAASGNLTEEQRAQAVDAALQISPTVYGVIGAATSAIAILAIFALIALYYTGISFATNDGIKFGQWFALLAWCSLPVVFGQIASLVNLLVSDARFLPQTQLNPLSFSSLLAIDPQGASIVENILLQLDVTTLWGTVLQILGYQAFTQRSVVRAARVVLGPLALIVLIASLAAVT
jgi:hypothetical protein